MKPVDIMIAAFQGELGFLTHPVNHVHTAEMGNQSVHSLALVSARYTHTALGILSQLIASHLLAVCQALDLRAMHAQYLAKLRPLFDDLMATILGPLFKDATVLRALHERAWVELQCLLDKSTDMDSFNRFVFVVKSLQSVVLEHTINDALVEPLYSSGFLQQLKLWSDKCAVLTLETYITNRDDYWANGEASAFLGVASRRIYQFIRKELKVPFLRENRIRTIEECIERGGSRELLAAVSNLTVDEEAVTPTIGDYITRIYEALRNGVMYEPAMECLREAHVADELLTV
jgi:phenylalanine ammonia-lyase